VLPPCKDFPSGADLAASLSSESYANPEFVGPQNRCDGKHPDTRTEDIRGLPDNTGDATHSGAIYSSTQEFIRHNSHDTKYIPDEQLHTMELCIYHGIKVQVES
jgi:hypothetical protein